MSARGVLALAACALALTALAVPRTARSAAFDADSAVAHAHALTPCVLHDQPGPLWSVFAPAMRGALGDSLKWVAALHTLVTQVGALDSVLHEEVTTVSPGVIAVDAHCRFANSPVPIEMIFAFDADGKVAGLLLRPDKSAPKQEHASAFLDYHTQTPLHLPVRGEWFVLWGGRTIQQNYHAYTRDQRFAMDLLVVKDGHSHKGDGKALADYYCWDQPVLAPAAGHVVWVQDSLPDNAPGHMDPAHATGNSLVLDVGHGEYLLFAHLREGTLRVKAGDHVAAETELGRVGNSGNTTEPHLHIHMQNGATPFEADGLPVQFLDYVADGKPVARGELLQGQVVRRAP